MKVAHGVVVAVTAWLIAVQPMQAQEAPANFLSVFIIDVHPGQNPVFENYIRQVQDAAEEIGAQPSAVAVYQNALGGPLNRYRIVLPFDDFAEMDAFLSPVEILVQAHGQEDAQEILEEGTLAVASVENVVRALQPDFSSSTSTALGGQYAEVITTRVDPARTQDYNDFLQALRIGEEAQGIRRDRRGNLLGEGGIYTAVLAFDTFEQRSQVPGALAVLQEQFGEGLGQRILDRAQAAVLGRTFEIIEFRPDLSRVPAN